MKLSRKLILLSILALGFTAAQTATAQFNWPYAKNASGIIETTVPAQPAGQTPVLNLTTPKIPVVRVGFVGLGMRGPDAVRRWMYIDGVQVVALCDHEKDRAEKCQEILKKNNMPEAAVYYGDKGYEELCKRKDIDLVYVATDWLHHVPVAKCAMENGKNVVIEVPSAMNLQDCWDLVNLSERTRLHCMILENCCYDWFELNTLNMAQQGVFGEILHVEGAYRHDLDGFWDYYWKKDANDKLGWRMEYNMKHRGDVYPTHGLGPVAQLLNIHRGDRMATLVAMDTKAVHGPEYVEKATGKKCENFKNGDHTTTLIRTELGKVIEIQHDVMSPEPYNRMYQLIGTKGFANKYPVEGYATVKESVASNGQPQVDNLAAEAYMNDKDKAAFELKYQHPLLKKYSAMAKEVGGHGGMDYIMDSRLVYCLQNGLPLDMDVYDLAEWCCLAELGSISMDNGFAPVAIPDFTRGHWRDIKGFSIAYASPEQEAKSAAIAKLFTTTLKTKGLAAAQKAVAKALKKK